MSDCRRSSDLLFRRRFVPLALTLAVLLTATLAAPPLGSAAIEGSGAAGAADPAPPRKVEALGVEIVAIRLTSNGYLLDFRFKVLNVEKSKPLFDKQMAPQLIDQASGLRMAVPVTPKGGALRHVPRGAPAVGKIYVAMFGNPGGFIKAGSLVTVVYGEHRIEDLRVQ